MSSRWLARVGYRTDPVGNGNTCVVEVTHDLEEIRDLHPLIERGPHWDTITKIEIVRVNHVTAPDLTLEQARAL